MIFALVEGFLSTLCGKLNDYLLSSLLDYLVALWGSIVAIVRTQETVARISGFNKKLDELHQDLRHIQPTNPESQEWLENLEDLAYDMEDLLNDYEMMHRLCMERLWISVLPVYLKYHKVFAEAKAITARLEELNKRKEELSPLMTTTIVTTSLATRAPEGSMSAEPILYGREREKSEIIYLLLRPNDSRWRFDVLPVVGMGGLGKTTIAQHVYQDDQVSRSFEVKAWSCASMDFDRCRIFQSIVGSSAIHDLCSLERQVHEKFKNKKFLVVLDDIWAESILELDRFWAPFMEAAPGSKFIITSRDAKIGRHIRMALTSVELGLLSEEECWSLFCWHSNIDSSSELVNIGKELSKKCRGLPLAAAVIGGLLRGTDNEGEWKSVLNDKSWVSKNGQFEITSVLKLSYDRLPYCIKRCFAFCTMYPEDFIFEREFVVNIWMSSGLIKCGRDGKDWKDVGGGYFDDLVSRCFLLKNGLSKTYMMHDLIREMGQEVCGHRYCAESQTKSVSLHKARHVAISYMSTLKNCVDLEKQNVMTWRTLIIWNTERDIQKDFSTMFLKLTKLRLLLFQNSKIKKLSNCLGRLKHLRHLSLQCEKFTELPFDIGRLSKLLVLSIWNCPLLTELPSEMGSLSCLLKLYIQDCPELTKLPSEIKSLVNLSTLCILACPQLIALPSEIGRLSSLYLLYISDCPGLTELPSEIKSLTNLSILFIGDCPNLTELPLEIGSLSSLSSLTIISCPMLTKLPPQIWGLSSLSVLQVSYCQGLTDLGLEDMGSLSRLSKLILLSIPWFVKLQEIGSLTNLSTLVIIGCGELIEIPREIGRMTSLSTLVIAHFLKLLRVPKEIGNLTNLDALYIEDCPRLTELPKEIENLTNLSTLYIEDCPGLSEVRTYYKSMDMGHWSKQSRRDLLWGSKATHIWHSK